MRRLPSPFAPVLRAGACLALLAASAAGAQQDSIRPSWRKPPRRIPVTAEHLRTAFGDDRARSLFERARVARVTQDSALRAYDAKSWLRISSGIGIKRLGRERLLFRSEQSARVRWSRERGAWVEPTGRRAVFTMGRADLDMSPATPIPYYPGRETLWVPGDAMGVGNVEVNERAFLHPLATGAEAYYRYKSGDSASIRLPDGRTIQLRELRITPRVPDYKAFVGSFWFDAERGNLVRAAYRLSAEMDIWQASGEEQRKDLEEAIERVRTDTSAVARAAVQAAEKSVKEETPPRLAKALVGPMKARMTGVTVEYGLHGGRFWLPRAHVAEGEAQFGFVRIPMRIEESYRYESVNVGDPMPPVTLAERAGITAQDTLFVGGGNVLLGSGTGRRAADTTAAGRRARVDSAVTRIGAQIDSLQRRIDSLVAKGDTAEAREMRVGIDWWTARKRALERRQAACDRGDSSYVAGVSTRFGGQVRTTIQLPCDPSTLANSPDLPGSIYEPGESLFDEQVRDELLASLDFGLQPSWGPQRPVLHSGVDMLRYNRVEGLSVGGTATSTLGLGYTARAEARFGVGDLVPNGELTLSRSNGRSQLGVTVFHRLGVANDDWGSPLTFGASVANLLYARDEGFYYRTFGAELTGLRDAPGPLGGATLAWRLFAERQRSAGVEPNTQWSLADALGDARFQPNIDAVPTSAFGAGAELARSFGANPLATRLDLRLRGEGALTDRDDSLATTGYGRAIFDATVARPVGRFSVGLTGAAGASAGDLPIQRAFFIGGLQTVRGQFARVDSVPGRVGEAFWLARGELGLGRYVGARPSLFYDAGWAGPRADFGTGRPLSGAGMGLSLLDGIVRFDVARGLWPEKRWRVDLYLDARF